MVVPHKGRGRMVLVVVCVLVLLASAAPAAEAKEDVIKRFSRADYESGGDTFTFSVAKGVDKLRIRVTTGTATQGSVEAIAVGPGGGAGGSRYLTTIAPGKTDEAVIEDPRAGTWMFVLDYDNEYDGTVDVRITDASGWFSFGGVTVDGSFWDVLGVVLALLTLGGGWFLYRRHTSRLNREMERIDETFRDLQKNVEQCRLELQDVQEDLRRQLVQRRLKESHYIILEKRIERYLHDLDRVTGTAPQPPEVMLEFE